MSSIDQKRILRRIRKCLAMAESGNEHEAAAALRQAKAMMDKYGITHTDVDRPVYDIKDQFKGKRGHGNMTRDESVLYDRVAGFFNCSCVYIKGWPIMAGIAPAPEIADYAAVNLLRQLRTARKVAAQKAADSIGRDLTAVERRNFNRSYNRGWLVSVIRLLEEFSSTYVDKGTRSQHMDALAEYTKVKGPKVYELPDIKKTPEAKLGLSIGLKDGTEAVLNHGVTDNQRKQALLEKQSKDKD